MSMKAWGVSWNENSVFLENGRFFDKIWAWEQLFCREKSEKKGILSTDCSDLWTQNPQNQAWLEVCVTPESNVLFNYYYQGKER